jgi:hypothetical protein
LSFQFNQTFIFFTFLQIISSILFEKDMSTKMKKKVDDDKPATMDFMILNDPTNQSATKDNTEKKEERNDIGELMWIRHQSVQEEHGNKTFLWKRYQDVLLFISSTSSGICCSTIKKRSSNQGMKQSHKSQPRQS